VTPGSWTTTYRNIPYRWIDMKSFEITHAGQTWTGTREVRDGILYVDSAYGSKSCDVEPYRHDVIAQATLMLAELVDEWRTKR
jgi:hypothetical protein